MKKLLLAALATTLVPTFALGDPLPSWTGANKASIIAFVDQVTDPDGADYVTPADRIAVFDNDGTLWAEQPVYFQLIFAVDRVAELGAANPDLLTSDALKAAANKDYKGVIAGGKEGLLEIMTMAHAGVSTTDFIAATAAWMETATHPTKDRPYSELTYQPMLELLSYLRDEGFATYIVSGGGIHFMRAFAQEAYGIPPNQVIGSRLESSYAVVDGVPVIMKEAALDFNDDKEGKPVGIDNMIGKRPIFAGGNSDGDFQMLEWTTAGDGPRMAMIVHHTDAEREWAYDREGHIGQLNRGLDEGPDSGWLIVDMKNDWKTVFADSE